MAGVVCARTLLQAGHHVTLIEKSRGFGGRMATRRTEFGGFDHGAQYFTVRDKRFAQVLLSAQDQVKAWSVSTVRVLDELGHVLASAPPPSEPHFVAMPGMSGLVSHWAQPLLTPSCHNVSGATRAHWTPASPTSSAMRSTPNNGNCAPRTDEGGQHVLRRL